MDGSEEAEKRGPAEPDVAASSSLGATATSLIYGAPPHAQGPKQFLSRTSGPGHPRPTEECGLLAELLVHLFLTFCSPG